MQTLAVILAIAGGACELAGLGMVIRGIGTDRKRARELLGRDRRHRRPRREYGPKLPVPGRTTTPGERGYAGFKQPDVHDIRREAGRGLATLANAMIGMREAVDKERDDLEEKLFREIDDGDDEMRERFKEVLESDLTERWIGVYALAAGIILAAAGSVLGSLS